MSSIAAAVSQLYVILMTGIFALGYRNNYIDIQDFKSRLFLLISVPFVIAQLLLLTALFLGSREEFAGRCGRLGKMPCAIWPLVFAFAVTVGCIFSEWPREAFLGSMGRQIGAVHLVLCVVIFYLIAITFETSRLVLIVFCLASFLEIGTGILNLWGLDPLRMYVNLIEEQHSFFIGTVGNKNVTANYLCLIVPVLIVLLVRAKTNLQKTVLFLLIALGFYYGIGVSSDSFLLGMLGCMAVLFSYCLLEEKNLTVFALVSGLFYAALWAMFISLKVGPSSPFFQALSRSGSTGIWLHPARLTAGGIIMFLFLYCANRWLSDRADSETVRKIWKRAVAVLAAGMVLFCLTAIVTNLLPAQAQEKLPRFLLQLKIDDSFGSNRGYIWERTAWAFADLPVRKKIFGIGADCFYLHMVPLYGNEMTLLYGAPFADAHNELLQFLMTCGILGAAGYFAALIGGCFTRKRGGFPMWAFVAAAYLLQGLVNNPHIVNTPLLFLALGVFRAQE